MKELLDKIGIYLPKYLSEESTKCLLRELRDFKTDGTKASIFTSRLNAQNILFQGDGMLNFPVCNMRDRTIKDVPVILLSNTCDMDIKNSRHFPTSIMYAPILNFDKYCLGLSKILTPQELDNHIKSLKNQEITQLMFIPKGAKLEYDGIVFLDKTNNMDNSLYNRDKIQNDRIFTLSDYGLYLFLLKISIHFTRIQEKIDRYKGYSN